MPMLALIGIGLMYGPISPDTNAIGSSAAITVKVARIVGPPTSSTARGMISPRLAAAERHVAVDVLDDDDRVVHQDPDREDQREERHAVDRESPGPGGEQRRRERDDHGRADDHGLAPADREPHQQHDGGRREHASFWISFCALSFAVTP